MIRWTFVAALLTGALLPGTAGAQTAPPTPTAPAPGPTPAAPTPPAASAPAAPAPAAPAPPATATPPATVAATGRVIDATTDAPLAGVKVVIDGTQISTVTAADGTFTIAAPVGVTLVISIDSHELSLVQVQGTSLGDVNLVKIGEAGGSEVIQIAGEAPIAAVGATTLDRREITSVAGTGNDLLASVDILPGVTSSPFGGPTGFNGVVIRGSSPEDSKILIDGFEVPFLYHTVGFRSILPTESIDTLEYLPGGFDVAYGRASSGIISVTTRAGDPEFGAQAELSVIDGGLLAHGSAGKKGGRYLLALRRSTIDLVLPSLIPDDADINLTTVPRYWDLQARYDMPVGQRLQLAFTAIGSDDSLELFADDEEDPDQRFFARTRFLRGIAEARWRKGQWSSVSAVSALITEVDFNIGRNQFFKMIQSAFGGRTELVRTIPKASGLTDVVFRLGANTNLERADISLAAGEAPDEGQPMGQPDPDDIRQRFEGIIWVPDTGAWANAAAGFGIARLSGGVRVDHFGRIGEVVVQPRGELTVNLPRSFKLRAAAGAYRRPPENQDEYLDKKLGPERSTQFVLGTEYGPVDGLKVQVSGYYTDRTHLLIRVDDGKYENKGRGTTMGGELLAIYRTDKASLWASYSISKSTRVDSPGARRRLFDFDQPHDLNLSGSYKLGAWQFGARFRYSSGQPFTPIMASVYDSDSDIYVPIFGEVNTERVTGHHQLDVRIDRSWKVGRVLLSAFLDVQNVYLNASTVGYGYSFDYSERFAFESIPILPSIGLRGEL
jgi:TonB-dependent Receptor Plug Domain/CarboxypepD_reg-like domain